MLQKGLGRSIGGHVCNVGTFPTAHEPTGNRCTTYSTCCSTVSSVALSLFSGNPNVSNVNESVIDPHADAATAPSTSTSTLTSIFLGYLSLY